MKNEITQPSAAEQAIAKIEFTDAEVFESIVAAISGLADKYRGLKITDTASYKAVVCGIAEMRNLRISVEGRRKEKKAKVLADGRQIDSGAKQLTELLLPIENDLKATKQAEDARKEAIKIEKDRLEQDRIETIKTTIAAFPPDISRLPQLLKITAPEIREMQDVLAAIEIDLEVFQEFTPEAIKTKEEKKNLLQDYYVARIQEDARAIKQKADEEALIARVKAQRIIDEKAKKEREAEAKRQEDALKKQEERQVAKQKIEDDRLAKIREKQEAETEKLRITQAEIEAQKQALQKEYDRLENEKLERKRVERERLAKIERDKTAKAEAEEQERLRLEQAAIEEFERKRVEAEEKARQEALRPDKKVLESYLNDLSSNIKMRLVPHMQTPEGKTALSFIQTSMEKVFADALKIIEDM